MVNSHKYCESELKFFKMPRHLTLVTGSKSNVALRLGCCHHPTKFGVDILSISLACHVISQDHVIKESCVFMGETL